MNFRVILDGLQESIEHVFGIELGERSRSSFGFDGVFSMHGFAHLVPAITAAEISGLMR